MGEVEVSGSALGDAATLRAQAYAQFNEQRVVERRAPDSGVRGRRRKLGRGAPAPCDGRDAGGVAGHARIHGASVRVEPGPGVLGRRPEKQARCWPSRRGRSRHKSGHEAPTGAPTRRRTRHLWHTWRVGAEAVKRLRTRRKPRVCGASDLVHENGRKGPYGIRTRAAAVRGRCPRPLDEWAVATAKCTDTPRALQADGACAARGGSGSRASIRSSKRRRISSPVARRS